MTKTCEQILTTARRTQPRHQIECHAHIVQTHLYDGPINIGAPTDTFSHAYIYDERVDERMIDADVIEQAYASRIAHRMRTAGKMDSLSRSNSQDSLTNRKFRHRNG